jgi:ABC-type Zn uptake system ZnuABC Zn-binding protein ZnuA
MTTRILLSFVAGLALAAGAAPAGAEPLRVVTTVPDLADLVREVGGDTVAVEALVKGPQDPHFVEPRPSFVRALHEADLFVQVGLELEIGWAPVLLQSARNAKVLPGGPGHLEAASAIAPLEVPTTRVDRSMGDVHPYGNPHFLADPLNGLRVAAAIRDRLTRLRPDESAGFETRYQAFARRLMEKLVGAELAARHEPEALASAIEGGRLDALLGGATDRVGGWLGALRPHAGTRVVQDHRLWPYFARRFQLEPVAELEPKPGIAPTTAHLADVVEQVRALHVPLILASPYFDPRHARRVAEQTGARVVVLAHQVGAREGTDGYLEMVDSNVGQVAEALRP